MDGRLTTKGAAKLLGLHQYTVLDKAKKGLIPGRKVRNRWYFTEKELVLYKRGRYTGKEVTCYTNEEGSGGPVFSCLGEGACAKVFAQENLKWRSSAKQKWLRKRTEQRQRLAASHGNRLPADG